MIRTFALLHPLYPKSPIESYMDEFGKQGVFPRMCDKKTRKSDPQQQTHGLLELHNPIIRSILGQRTRQNERKSLKTLASYTVLITVGHSQQGIWSESWSRLLGGSPSQAPGHPPGSLPFLIGGKSHELSYRIRRTFRRSPGRCSVLASHQLPLLRAEPYTWCGPHRGGPYSVSGAPCRPLWA